MSCRPHLPGWLVVAALLLLPAVARAEPPHPDGGTIRRQTQDILARPYRLDEEGRVLFQRGCTNREYLALFTDRPEVGRDLRVFVDTLDANWYGQRATDERRYAECLALYEGLLRRA